MMEKYIDIIPNYPKDGIVFYDLNNLYINHFDKLMQNMSLLFGETKFDAIVGIGSRGYILGAGLANKFNVNFIPASATLHSKDYIEAQTTSEYATKTIKLPKINLAGKSVLVVDDIIATGNTIKVVKELCESLEAKVLGIFAILDLSEFKKDFEYKAMMRV